MWSAMAETAARIPGFMAMGPKPGEKGPRMTRVFYFEIGCFFQKLAVFFKLDSFDSIRFLLPKKFGYLCVFFHHENLCNESFCK
jgi:hypothetical protein